MVAIGVLDADSRSLHPIPPTIHYWLRAVVFFGFLSLVTSVTLFFLLLYRLIKWRIKSKKTNQFVILIFNLVLADIQQSFAFLLNVEWLRIDKVDISSSTCWAQGWFVSTGDLASGVWCFAIGVHTLASVIFDYRLSQRWFFTTVVALWVFVYGISLIPVALHPQDLYVRAGVWVCSNFCLSFLCCVFHVLTICSVGFTMTLLRSVFGPTTSGSSLLSSVTSSSMHSYMVCCTTGSVKTTTRPTKYPALSPSLISWSSIQSSTSSAHCRWRHPGWRACRITHLV